MEAPRKGSRMGRLTDIIEKQLIPLTRREASADEELYRCIRTLTDEINRERVVDLFLIGCSKE